MCTFLYVNFNKKKKHSLTQVCDQQVFIITALSLQYLHSKLQLKFKTNQNPEIKHVLQI